MAGPAMPTADINADHNPMLPSWTSANDGGPLTSTRAPHGRPTLHLESERPARVRGFESLRFRSADQQERRSGAPPSAPPCWAGSQFGSQLAPTAVLSQ